MDPNRKKKSFHLFPAIFVSCRLERVAFREKKPTNSSDFEGKSVGLTAERCRTCSATDWHCGQPIKQHTVGRNRKWILCPNWSHSFNRILCSVCVCVLVHVGLCRLLAVASEGLAWPTFAADTNRSTSVIFRRFFCFTVVCYLMLRWLWATLAVQSGSCTVPPVCTVSAARNMNTKFSFRWRYSTAV